MPLAVQEEVLNGELRRPNDADEELVISLAQLFVPLLLEVRHWRASEGLGEKDGPFFPELLQTLAQNEQGIGDALVFFAGFLDLAVSHEVLEFIVSAQPQHFLAAAGGIPSPESRMNDAEKGFKLIGF